jgi:hypothetical protein
MRSRTGPSVGSPTGYPCGSVCVVGIAPRGSEPVNGSSDDAASATVRGAIRRVEPSSSTTWVNGRTSLSSHWAGEVFPPVRGFAGCLSGAMTRKIEAMISSTEGSEWDFASGMSKANQRGRRHLLGYRGCASSAGEGSRSRQAAGEEQPIRAYRVQDGTSPTDTPGFYVLRLR